MGFRDGVAMPLSYRLLGVVILVVGLTGCGARFLPREFATARDAFERYAEPMQTRIFAAPAAEVYRAAELATRQAGLTLEYGEEAAGVILASRTPQGRRGTAYFYRIAVRASAPTHTEVTLVTKIQQGCTYDVVQAPTTQSDMYCRWIATDLRWGDTPVAAGQMREFLNRVENNLLSAGVR